MKQRNCRKNRPNNGARFTRPVPIPEYLVISRLSLYRSPRLQWCIDLGPQSPYQMGMSFLFPYPIPQYDSRKMILSSIFAGYRRPQIFIRCIQLLRKRHLETGSSFSIVVVTIIFFVCINMS